MKRFPTTKRKRRSKRRLSFRTFIRRVNPRYQFYRHTEVLIDVLQAVADDQVKRLMVFWPPRHSKSETVSRLFSAYYLYRHPERFVGLASYGADLAYTLSRNAREYYRASGEPLAVEGVENWETGEGGGLWAAGVGGPATGKGFHCLPGDSLIVTEYGTMTIEALCRSRGLLPRILSYDHNKQETEWRRIVATAIQPGKPLVEVSFSGGGRMRCTADHLVYSVERGYRQAGDLVPGETVIQVSPLQDVPDLRDENRAQCSVRCLRSRGEGYSVSGGLRILRKGIHQKPVRSRKVSKHGKHGTLLLGRMQPKPSRREESPSMSRLRRLNRNQDKPILRGVQQATQGKHKSVGKSGMSVLRKRVSPDIPQDEVLLERVCGLRPFPSDARQEQQQLQGRAKLRGMVQEDAPAYPGARRTQVRRLRSGECSTNGESTGRRTGSLNIGYSPYRSETSKQCGFQPDYTMPGVSRDIPQNRDWETGTISTVTRLGIATKFVYDLQVERNSNFFADGVLVHNCGIVDDPLKNAEEAASATIREKQKDWWRSTFYTRQEPDAAIIVIQTRWNEDDLAGWLLSEEATGDDEPERWHIVSMPAIYGEDEPLEFPDTCTVEADWRKPGEALCPERYPIAKLRKYQRRLGGYFWGALFQQHPRPRSGTMFQREWFSIVDAAPADAKRVRYWDKAGTKDGGKATAGVLIARDADGVVYVEHVVRGQYSALEREKVIRQTAEADAARYGRVLVWMEQEPGSGGKESAEATVRNLAGFRVYKETVSGDKATRAEPFAAQCAGSNVRLVRGAWNSNYLDELTAFPHGVFSDQVDASAGGYNKLASTRKVATVR